MSPFILSLALGFILVRWFVDIQGPAARAGEFKDAMIFSEESNLPSKTPQISQRVPILHLDAKNLNMSKENTNWAGITNPRSPNWKLTEEEYKGLMFNGQGPAFEIPMNQYPDFVWENATFIIVHKTTSFESQELFGSNSCDLGRIGVSWPSDKTIGSFYGDSVAAIWIQSKPEHFNRVNITALNTVGKKFSFEIVGQEKVFNSRSIQFERGEGLNQLFLGGSGCASNYQGTIYEFMVFSPALSKEDSQYFLWNLQSKYH